jgi:hypothetical protein
MKKHLPLVLALASVFFAFPVQAEPNPLYQELSRGGEVKVYVAPVTDPQGTKLDVTALHQAFEDALKNRKSIRFAIVPTESEAKLVIEPVIKGFVFSETDPVDMLVGVAAIAMDAATIEHFASTEVTVTVREQNGGRVRWNDTVRASITDAAMSEAEAREKILFRAADLFVRSAFGKKKV